MSKIEIQSKRFNITILDAKVKNKIKWCSEHYRNNTKTCHRARH